MRLAVWSTWCYDTGNDKDNNNMVIYAANLMRRVTIYFNL